jgi:23S rRNA pseudouridine2605 synthase
VREGRVAVNGRVAGLGDGADPEHDRITLDGRPVRAEAPVYWLLHKPRGVLTTARDPEGRRTVMDLVPERTARVFPVGRLDRDTEGLLLLTNDGELAQALLHPSRESPRVYRVTVKGRFSDAAADRLARGVRLDDGTVTAPAKVGPRRHVAATDRTTFTLTLVEGRKRQIRRALLALGHRVHRLVRTKMGPLTLGRLPAGGARRLTVGEERRLLEHARRHGARPKGGGPGGPGGVRAGGGSRSGGRSSRGRGSGKGPSAR